MSPYVRYTLMRFLLFALVVLLGYATGMRGLLLIIFALLVSALLSYVLLGGPRRALVERMQQRTERRHERAVARDEERVRSGKVSRMQADNAAEDADDDARHP